MKQTGLLHIRDIMCALHRIIILASVRLVKNRTGEQNRNFYRFT